MLQAFVHPCQKKHLVSSGSMTIISSLFLYSISASGAEFIIILFHKSYAPFLAMIALLFEQTKLRVVQSPTLDRNALAPCGSILGIRITLCTDLPTFRNNISAAYTSVIHYAHLPFNIQFDFLSKSHQLRSTTGHQS